MDCAKAAIAPNLQNRLANLRDHAERLQKQAYRAEQLADKLVCPTPSCGADCSPRPTPYSLDDTVSELLVDIAGSLTRIEMALGRAHEYVGSFGPEQTEIANSPLQKSNFR